MVQTGEAAPQYARAAIETISPEDFETASIRSAAPSYISEAPSYHSVLPHNDPAPPYTPPESSASTSRAPVSLLGPELPGGLQGPGLPPIPSGPLPSDPPTLAQFRIPSWSNTSANPTARQYHSVAMRRAAAASRSSPTGSPANTEGIVRRMILDRIEDEERSRHRPLEDPYLVGEVAAARARQERLARENGEDILTREDRRWDWFLSQMAQAKEREEREERWESFRRSLGLHLINQRPAERRLGRRLGAMGAR